MGLDKAKDAISYDKTKSSDSVMNEMNQHIQLNKEYEKFEDERERVSVRTKDGDKKVHKKKVTFEGDTEDYKLNPF